jgi:hypothetical protein
MEYSPAEIANLGLFCTACKLYKQCNLVRIKEVEE